MEREKWGGWKGIKWGGWKGKNERDGKREMRGMEREIGDIFSNVV